MNNIFVLIYTLSIIKISVKNKLIWYNLKQFALTAVIR